MRILNASGCLDALAAPEVARQLDAFVTKTVTPLPREGSAPPRIAETAHGMLNAIGLANPGRERFLTDHLGRLRELGIPLWVSVGGFCAADYAETCSLLSGIEAFLKLRQEGCSLATILVSPYEHEAPEWLAGEGILIKPFDPALLVGEVRKAALASGMKSLLADGRLKVLAGTTTAEEVVKVAQVEGIVTG